MQAAVFLDRDNTLVHNDGDLGDPEQVRLIQGAASAIASLRGLGYRVIVVTNQGGVARGKFGESDVEAVNNRINEVIRRTSGAWIDRFYFCPYHPEGSIEKYKREHPWRKPQPGMILQAATDLGLDLSLCWMVGDQMRDVQAGAGAKVRTILLTPQASTDQPPLKQELSAAALLGKDGGGNILPDFIARNLVEAVRIIAQQRRSEGLDETRLNEAMQRSKASTGSSRPILDTAKPVPPDESPSRQSELDVPGRGQMTEALVESEPSDESVGEIKEPLSPVASAQNIPERTPVIERVVVPAVERTEPRVEREAAAPSNVPSVTAGESLRQILQELRSQREVHGEMTLQGILAIALQVIAVVLLIGAFWVGGQDSGAFLRWISAALILQLMTIAMLLFRK